MCTIWPKRGRKPWQVSDYTKLIHVHVAGARVGRDTVHGLKRDEDVKGM
jgi:hypothetical protein